MSKKVEVKIKVCDRCKKRYEVKRWSKSKLCRDCRRMIQQELVSQLKQGKGVFVDRWYDGMKRYIEAIEKVKSWNK